MQFKNTSGKAGDEIMALFAKHTRNGVFTPFKVRLGSQKLDKKPTFFSTVEEVKE
jgi:hypothetical protein